MTTIVLVLVLVVVVASNAAPKAHRSTLPLISDSPPANRSTSAS
jgi:hypothetical protein